MEKRIYDKYKKHNFWEVIERAIDTLCINEDLEEKTARYYIVGYLTKCLCEQDQKLKAIKNTVKDCERESRIGGITESGKKKKKRRSANIVLSKEGKVVTVTGKPR